MSLVRYLKKTCLQILQVHLKFQAGHQTNSHGLKALSSLVNPLADVAEETGTELELRTSLTSLEKISAPYHIISFQTKFASQTQAAFIQPSQILARQDAS